MGRAAQGAAAFRGRLTRLETAILGATLLLALGLFGLELWRSAPVGVGASVEASRRAYADLWANLDRAAGEAAARIGDRAGAGSFEALVALAGERRGRGLTFLLIDPDGAAVAWSGDGLLHALEAEDYPRAGRFYRASFSAVSLLAVEPLDDGPRPWRMVAGRSLSADRLPVPALGVPAGTVARWSLVDTLPDEVDDALVIELAGAPSLIVRRGGAAGRSPVAAAPGGERRAAWLVLGLGLLALAAVRGRGAAAGAGELDLLRWGRLAPAALGVVACAAAAGLSWHYLVALPAGLGLTVVSWRRAAARLRVRWPALLGAGAALAMAASAAGLQAAAGPIDLAESILGNPRALALRLLLLFPAAALLLVAARRGGDLEEARETPAWLGFAALLAAGAAHDVAWAGLLLLALGGAFAGVWIETAAPFRRRAAAGLLLLFAATLSGAAGELAYRQALKQHLRQVVLPALAPPTVDEVDAIEREVAAYFGGIDLADSVLQDPSGLDGQDLAYELWHHSPLARGGTLSALAVQPFGGPVSTFSFGLPMRRDGSLDWTPPQLQDLWIESWEDAEVAGEARVMHRGRVRGILRYWLLLRPGFRLSGAPQGSLALGLLRGGPGALQPAEEAIGPARYALYTARGDALVSPWKQAPRLPAELGEGGEAVVETPAGGALALAAPGSDGIRVLYLSLLTPLGALERVGAHLLGVVILLGGAAALGLLLAMPRGALPAALRRTLRSYPKRLLVVNVALVLVPLVVLNAVLLQVLGQRQQQQQRLAGEAALDSAQRVLGEYILSLEPGFGLETVLDDELLLWLSRVVHHEVNLYWGSNVHVSSKRELFTAGFLPGRIPGEIFSRLSVEGSELATRINQAGGARYLEIYAPLRVPGVTLGPARLFLSIPLLASQEEAAAEIASLRRKAILATALLVLVLAAVGARLARSFSDPLVEIVRGTQRIAEGATSLGLAPPEQELATLVEAIDRMAGRIAEARTRLLREKDVVERMVENITSGVVSLDRTRRVLLHNRVAAELLGVEVGDDLDARLRESEALAGVADFVAAASGAALHQQTVRLEAEGDEEREWSLVWVPVPGEGEPAALLVVEDITEVLQGQRLLAWAEMARIIAHEIKNPLTPIRLSAEHMREVRRHDPEQFEAVFESCTANIVRHVDELQNIASEFSTYSRIPRTELEEGDLGATVASVVEGYLTAPPKGVRIELEGAAETVRAEFDARLLGRALRNLIENALRVSPQGGSVRVRLAAEDGWARVSVADDGPGVEPHLLHRIFEPYFSTHDTGTGLGLPIAKRISEEHGGSIAARNRPQGGLEVVVSLPLAGRAAAAPADVR